MKPNGSHNIKDFIMKFGVLKSSTNTGADSEILLEFAAPLSIISNEPTYVQDTNSLRRITQSQGTQRWEIETKIVPSNNSANFLVHSATSSAHTPVFIRMPQVYGLTYTVASRNVTTTTTKSSNTIPVDGALVVGEFIKFNNHNKVYLVIDDGLISGSIKTVPSLRQDVPAGTAIKAGLQVTFRAYYDTSVHTGITYVDGVLSDPGSVRFIEAL